MFAHPAKRELTRFKTIKIITFSVALAITLPEASAQPPLPNQIATVQMRDGCVTRAKQLEARLDAENKAAVKSGSINPIKQVLSGINYVARTGHCFAAYTATSQEVYYQSLSEAACTSSASAGASGLIDGAAETRRDLGHFCAPWAITSTRAATSISPVPSRTRFGQFARSASASAASGVGRLNRSAACL